ncbi:MAG TPA: M14 family zinc carboxypeptidase [Candidatus Acidoferrales bacterium]|nr:M14 family zinc carboxypeptidase [Candidatus Acidoferrales bacterium]
MKIRKSSNRQAQQNHGTLEKLFLFILSLILLVGLTSLRGRADDGVSSAAKRASSDGAKAAPAPPIDEGYTAKIKQFTTDPMFSTELVDHLPASATVPSPEKILGYIAGAENHLTYTKDLYRYYDALAKATPRVKVWRVGKSEEGRDFLMVAVSDDSNMAQIEKFKQITAKLADPRKTSDAEAQQLIKDGKPMYWASGSIHSPETGSPEMLMELAYRLAVEDTPFIQNIRKNSIVLITPVLEVDGRDRMVDTYNYHLAHPDKPQMNLLYWGHYVAHDNNRDGIAQALQLSKVQMRSFLEWHATVMHDLHESEPFLYVMTGTGPYNAWLDPIVVSEWQEMAYNDIKQMTERGVPGVWTHDFYDGWAANYMLYAATGHNAVGRFYETFGNGGADTRMRNVPANQTTREWFRPNPPLSRVNWSLRDNVNMQESGILFSMGYTADHAQEFLSNFYLKSKRSVAKAATEGPAAYVILNDGKRPVLAAQLAALLQQQGCEIQTLNSEIEVKQRRPAPPAASSGGDGGRGGRGGGAGGGGGATSGGGAAPATDDASQRAAGGTSSGGTISVKIPAGSYVIRMDQPYSRMADMLLDTQYFNVNDPRPYDDTGWTLGPLRNVATVRVTDNSILKASMTLIQGEARTTGNYSASAAKYFLVNANAEPVLATLRFRLKNVKMFAAEAAFEADGAKYNAGTFIIPADGNPADVASQLESATKDLGIRVKGSSAEPSVAKHEVAVPRIAVVHTWVNTQNEGWYRLGLDEMKVPYAYISDHDLRDTANLRDHFDVIIFPPGAGNIATMINGIPKRIEPDGTDFSGPIPWKHTDLTPNLATADGQPDQTDDIRGGLGFEGLAHLKKFIDDGGLFIPITSVAQLPIDLGMTSGISIAPTPQLQARGSIYLSNVEDRTSPIAYGYDETLGVYFSQAPVFRVSLGLGGGGGFGGGGGEPGGAGGGEGRPSGRGTATDPDVVQARPYMTPEARQTPRTPRERELYIDPDTRRYSAYSIPPESMWPRVIVRFAPERDLFISGELAGGSALAEAPAVVDIPVGRGHVVFFAINPMWRQETQGSFMLMMNAALNFDHLQAGRQAMKPATDAADEEDEISGATLDTTQGAHIRH